MYLDQQNETVLCAGNCLFGDAAGKSPAAAIVVGPDATTTATGVSPIVLQLGEGFFDTPTVRHNHGSDIQFAINSNNAECNCVVALGSGMVDVETKQGATLPGQPTTNDSTRVSGQTTYGPPTLANAGTVGVPPTVQGQTQFLQLTPNELGIIATTSGTAAFPGTSGLKLRVECSSQSGKVKLVVLAGTSNTESVLADGIGGGVSGC